MKLIKSIIGMAIIMLIVVSAIGCAPVVPTDPDTNLPSTGNIDLSDVKPNLDVNLPTFESCEDLREAFEEMGETYNTVYEDAGPVFASGFGGFAKTAAPMAAAESVSASRDFSATNIQVEGVDEADIIKTDGNHIYMIANGKLIIAQAYPVENAKILSETKLKDFNPTEMYIDGDRLLLFGRESQRWLGDGPIERVAAEIMPYPRYMSTSSVKLFDISDKEYPEVIKTLDFEGNYLSSRKIGEYVYFVVNAYPNWNNDCIVPLMRENNEDFATAVACTDVHYFEPMQARSFLTIVGMSMQDKDDINTKVIAGSGQNVYASLDNLYVAETNYAPYYWEDGKRQNTQSTTIHKFHLDDGNVNYKGNNQVPGHILNQFSMDEHNGNFRIATTLGNVWDSETPSTNNLYVLDKDLEIVGELEGLAPGERIYSVRFMGDRGYIVTFKKVDPLFVIDLSDPEEPDVLGKLKIPGYSDYLHPYDETHIIGIGKDTVEAEESLKEGRGIDFAWYQGIKMAIFDVSDVENPIELHKVVIGDRGTQSPALHDHKAFLFHREKNLLVMPILLAEIENKDGRGNQYGDYTFQGAYVYDITLENGFDLRGKVSHYDNDDIYKKSGYYFHGDASIQRSLFIEDVLYTFSQSRLQLNSLEDLDRLKVLEVE